MKKQVAMLLLSLCVLRVTPLSSSAQLLGIPIFSKACVIPHGVVSDSTAFPHFSTILALVNARGLPGVPGKLSSPTVSLYLIGLVTERDRLSGWLWCGFRLGRLWL